MDYIWLHNKYEGNYEAYITYICIYYITFISFVSVLFDKYIVLPSNE